jgi:hypothetical protein
MFCAPVLQVAPDLTFLEGALTELIRIEAIWKQSAARDAQESIKGYLAVLSEDPVTLIPVP